MISVPLGKFACFLRDFGPCYLYSSTSVYNLSIATMFDQLTFKPVEGYDKQRKADRHFEYGRGRQVSAQLLADIIAVEYDCRRMIQEEEFTQGAIKELPKVKNDEDMEFLRENKETLRKLRSMRPIMRPMLYLKVVKLPQRLKKAYDKIRQNPTWYLREELVNNCKGMGGCCGRSCRCCESRHLGRDDTVGIGHCTIACWCCAYYRDSRYDGKEGVEIEKVWKDQLVSSNPSYLLMMAEAYFSMPGILGLGKIPTPRVTTWNWKKGAQQQWRRISGWLK